MLVKSSTKKVQIFSNFLEIHTHGSGMFAEYAKLYLDPDLDELAWLDCYTRDPTDGRDDCAWSCKLRPYHHLVPLGATVPVGNAIFNHHPPFSSFPASQLALRPLGALQYHPAFAMGSCTCACISPVSIQSCLFDTTKFSGHQTRQVQGTRIE